MTIYNLYFFNRKGTCLAYKEWCREKKSGISQEEEFKLVHGMLLSLRSFSHKLATRADQLPLVHSYRTSSYKMNYIETATGLKMVLNTDPDAIAITELMQSIFLMFVDTVLKNPFADTSKRIDSELFHKKLDELVLIRNNIYEMTILATDGWILATRGKKTRRRIFIATTKCKANLTQCSGTNANKSSFENLVQRVERVRLRIPCNFRLSIIASIERILQNRKLPLIRVFGIGPFDVSLDSIYQLALLEHLKDHFSVPFTTSQDPLTTNLEKQFMKSRGIRVLPPDDLRSNPIVKTSKDEFTLLYMIHCTQDMYENVLSYYAGISALQRLILIGNDPHGISNHSVSSTRHFKNFAKICTSIQFPEFEPCPNAFHKTAMCFVEEDE